MKKILFVDDGEDYHKYLLEDLEGKEIEVISALSIESAKECFEKNPDVDLIIMDACVPGDRPTTQGLIQEIRKTFSGPMIAVSSLGVYRKMLMEAGCDYEGDKFNLAKKVLEVLEIE